MLVHGSIRADPQAPSTGRKLVSRLEGAVPPGVVADAQLLVSELVTNSVRHGDLSSSRIEVSIELDDRALRVEVEDRGAGFDAGIPPPPAGVSGWGLHLLESLATEWGVDSARGFGTRAWFVLRW